MDQRAAERQFLLHAARELAGGAREEWVETGRPGQIVDARFALGPLLSEQPTDEVEVLEHAERRVKVAPEALRHVGDAGEAVLPERGVPEVAAQCPHLAGLDLAHAGDQPEQGRLADAVRADESSHPTRRDLERHVVERDGLAVAVRNAFEPGGDGGDLLPPFRLDKHSHRRGGLLAGLLSRRQLDRQLGRPSDGRIEPHVGDCAQA